MFTVYPILPFFFKSTGQYLDGTLGVLPDLISFGILKCLEDTSVEACDADGVYVVLQNRRWGERFENRWAICVELVVTENIGGYYLSAFVAASSNVTDFCSTNSRPQMSPYIYIYIYNFFFNLAQQPLLGQGLLII